jgi:hypothetical protein
MKPPKYTETELAEIVRVSAMKIPIAGTLVSGRLIIVQKFAYEMQ